MAKAQFRFGALTSADVILWLASPNEKKYDRNPVYLHSVILKRSKFFDAKLSKRWPSDKPTEIRVTTSHNFDDYLKCIELMYDERVYFSNVNECLAILSVASELLADDCINECMQYLEAVQWSAEQESQIRNVLSGLGLKLLPDLAARLDRDDNGHIEYVENCMKEMVSLAKRGADSTVQRKLEDILKGNTSRDVVDVCGRVLLQEFSATIECFISESQKRHGEFRETPESICSRLGPLFGLIDLCDRGILKGAFMAFCENKEFFEMLNSAYLGKGNDQVFKILLGFTTAIGDGKIIISRDSRVSFLTTWLPKMAKFTIKDRPYKGTLLDNAVLNVVKSLPQVDKQRICVVWATAYRSNYIDITTPLTLSIDVHDARYKSTAK